MIISGLSKMKTSPFAKIEGKGGKHEKGDYQDEQRRVKSVGSNSQSD
jgi:hypothetical protein